MSEKENIEEKSGYLDRVLELYQRAKKTTLSAPKDVTNWLANDIKGSGAWEYKLEEIDIHYPHEAEKKMNELGNDRWELVHTMPGDVHTFLFKRPKESFLDYIPAQELVGLLPLSINRLKKKD